MKMEIQEIWPETLTGLIWLRLWARWGCFSEHCDEMGSDYLLKKGLCCMWLVGWLVGWSVGRLVRWFFRSFFGLSFSRLIDCLLAWLVLVIYLASLLL